MQKWSLSVKLTLSYAVLVMVILLLTMGYLLRMQTTHITELVDTTISNLSQTLSVDPVIVEALEKNEIQPDTKTYLEQLGKQKKYADYIVLVNTEDIRLYHRDAEKIGQQFQGGDEKKALEGEAPYITDGKGSKEYQRRAFSSVYNKDGEVIGFVMVSAYARSITNEKKQEIMKYLVIIAIAMLIGLLFSFLIAKNVRKTLLGYEPTQISHLFLQREEILGTLSEGLLLVNRNGVCEYINPAGKQFLQVEENGAEQAVQVEQFIDQYIKPKLDSKEQLQQYQLQLGDTTLLMDKIPITAKDKLIGALVLLSDKTETTKLAEELTGVNHIIQALRATTHEHKNKLHVILGLLQTGETKEAMDYITSGSQEEEDNSHIMNSIQNKTIAALILGKKSRAKELNISFNLLKDSFLEAHNAYLSAADLVTIIGNLVENAFDALTNVQEIREVNLFINSGAEGLTIIVDDTGSGMDSVTCQRLRKQTYTTKGEGHGVGLTLIRNIVQRCEGILDIESEPGEGSSFSVTIHKKRTRYEKESRMGGAEDDKSNDYRG